MLHGRLLGGLAARAIETGFIEAGWRAARLTVDLFRPAALAPVQVETVPVRTGRRIVVADALLHCQGHLVARVTALILRESSEPPGAIWRPDDGQWPDPETLPADPGEELSGGPDWLVRTVSGGFASPERGRVWTNDQLTLLPGEAMSPLVRAAISADLACPLANSSDQGLHYINGDYTLALGRYPVGEWIGLEVNQQIAADGVSIASSTLVDRIGPFATSTGTSLANPPLQAPS